MPGQAPAPAPAPDPVTIRGTDGNDVLENQAGSPQVLAGGPGDDLYRLALPDDQVIEREEEGTDEISVGFPYTLPPNVERLTVWGTSFNGGSRDGANLVGNALDNYISGAPFTYTSIYGLEGNDTLCTCSGRSGAYLDGGPGNDTLLNNLGQSLGGPGADIFGFAGIGGHTDPRQPSTILDFTPSEGDQIQVANDQQMDAAAMFAQGYLIWNATTRVLTWTSVPFETNFPIYHNFRLPNLDVGNFDPSWIRVVPR